VQDVLQLDPSSVNRHDGDGRSALHHAAERDGVAVAAVLLDHGAAWDSPDRMGLTPLMVCAEPSPWRDDLAVRVAALLMAHGARPTAGEVAALDLDLPFEAAQVDAPDAWGRRPLLRAVEHGRRRQVRRLLDAGADASAPTAAGRTPLMVAVARARDGTDPGIVADLVSAGADPDARDRAGDTPRRLAQRHRLDAVLRLLG
jgi:ankyrin repeat protein